QANTNRTFTTPYGTSGNVQRSESYNYETDTGQTSAERSVTAAGGSSVTAEATAATGSGVSRETTVTNARTGQTSSDDCGGGDHYASPDGQVYRSSDEGWQRQTLGGWENAGGDTAWADQEQQARSQGFDRWSDFTDSGWASRFQNGGWASQFQGGGG